MPTTVQIAPPAVDDCAQVVAGRQPVRLRERLRQHGLVGIADARQSSVAQRQPVEPWLVPLRDGHELPDHRLLEALDVEDRRAHDARFHRLHAGDFAQPRGQVLGRPLDAGEHLPEPVALVVGDRRLLERLDRGERHHQHADAGGHDQRDGQHLAAHPPQVAQQLAVQRAHHQVISRAGRRRGLRRSSWMRPSPMTSTRSAMSAITALCVISTVEVPSSRVDALDGLEHQHAGLAVERAGRLVAEQQVGALGDRARDRHALLLAARELRREVVQALAEPDERRAPRRAPSGCVRSR